jgi:hypothetical protein
LKGRGNDGLVGRGFRGRVLRLLGLGVLAGAAEMTVTPEQVKQLRSLNLREQTVRRALAGFIAHEFGCFEPVVLHALGRFVEGIDTRQLDKYVAIHNAEQIRSVKRR